MLVEVGRLLNRQWLAVMRDLLHLKTCADLAKLLWLRVQQLREECPAVSWLPTLCLR